MNKDAETRVGFATTRALEDITVDYIRAHTTANGRYEGSDEMLFKYQSLHDYNRVRKTSQYPVNQGLN